MPPPAITAAELADTLHLADRGAYIVRDAAVCGHCHAADPENDPDGPLSGGHAFKNWRVGVIRASNITPDSATGIGAWTEAEIVRAVRNGENRKGHVLAPIMPYAWFHRMSDRDAIAVARYLKSQPPVRNPVENDANLVFEAAKLLFISPEDHDAAEMPRPGVTPEYGRYLATHVALCGDCHTPRSGLTAAPKMDHLFEGDDDSSFPAHPSNLTPDVATGIGTWTQSDFVRAMRTGVRPNGVSMHPFMPWRQLRRMTDGDLAAIYSYLKMLPPVVHDIPTKASAERP